MTRGKKPGSAGTAREVQDAGHQPISDELDDRRKRLEAKLAEKGVGRKSESAENESGKNAGVAQAVKLSSEFIAGVLAGAGLGWLIDRFAGTSPWGLIVFLLLGFCAGTLNILRSAGYVAENDGIESGKGSDHKDKH
ncbi:MAG: AtpZ/AtpI family protein [Phyllobacterium sp.]